MSEFKRLFDPKIDNERYLIKNDGTIFDTKTHRYIGSSGKVTLRDKKNRPKTRHVIRLVYTHFVNREHDPMRFNVVTKNGNNLDIRSENLKEVLRNSSEDRISRGLPLELSSKVKKSRAVESRYINGWNGSDEIYM